MLSNRIYSITFFFLLSFIAKAEYYYYQSDNVPCIDKGETYPHNVVYKKSNSPFAPSDDDQTIVVPVQCCPGLAISGGKCVDNSPKSINLKKCNNRSECAIGEDCYPATYDAYFYNEDDQQEVTQLEIFENKADEFKERTGKDLYAQPNSENFNIAYLLQGKSPTISYCNADEHCMSYNCVKNPYFDKSKLNSKNTKPAYDQPGLKEKYRICVESKVCRPALEDEVPNLGVNCKPGLIKFSDNTCKPEGTEELTPPHQPSLNFKFDKEGCNIETKPMDFLTRLKRVRSFEWLIRAAQLKDCHVEKMTGKSMLDGLKENFVKPLDDGRNEAYDGLKKTFTEIHQDKLKLLKKKLDQDALVGESSEDQKGRDDYELELMAANRILGLEMINLMQREQMAIKEYEQRLLQSFMLAQAGIMQAKETWKNIQNSKEKACKKDLASAFKRLFKGKMKFKNNWANRYNVWGPRESNSKSYDDVTAAYMAEVGVSPGDFSRQKKFLGIKGRTKYWLHDNLMPGGKGFKSYGGKGGSGKYRRRMHKVGKDKALVGLRDDTVNNIKNIFANSNYVGDFELGLNKGCIATGEHEPTFFDELKFQFDDTVGGVPRTHSVEELDLVSNFCQTNPDDLTCKYKKMKVTCDESNKIWDEMMSLTWAQNILYSHSKSPKMSGGEGSSKYKLLVSVWNDLDFLIKTLTELSGPEAMIKTALRQQSVDCMEEKFVMPALEYAGDKLNKGMVVGKNKYENKEKVKNWQKSKQSIIDCKNCNLTIMGGEVEFDIAAANNESTSDAKWKTTMSAKDYATYNTLKANLENNRSAYNKEMRSLETRARRKLGDSQYDELVASRSEAYNSLRERLNTSASTLNSSSSSAADGSVVAADSGAQGASENQAIAAALDDKKTDGKEKDKNKDDVSKDSDKKSSAQNSVRKTATYKNKTIDTDVNKDLWGKMYSEDKNDKQSYSTHTGLKKAEIKESLKNIELQTNTNRLSKDSGDSLFQIITKTYFRTGYKRVLVGPLYKDIQKKKSDYIDIGDRALHNDQTGVLNIDQNKLE